MTFSVHSVRLRFPKGLSMDGGSQYQKVQLGRCINLGTEGVISGIGTTTYNTMTKVFALVVSMTTLAP